MRFAPSHERVSDSGDAAFSRVPVNLHAHTTASDGWMTPLEAHRYAFTHGLTLAITDHNGIGALNDLGEEAKKDPKVASEIARTIVPGIEVQPRERTELLVYARSIEELQTFFRDEIINDLQRSNPRYKGANFSIHELIAKVRDHDLFIGIPHFKMRAHGIGGGKLLNEELRQVTRALHDYRDHVYVEQTPVVGRIDNAIASYYGKRHGFPILANADSHLGDHDRSFTHLHAPRSGEPLIESIFDQIHERQPRRSERHIERMTRARALQIGSYIATRLGVSGIVEMARNTLQKHHILDHKASFISDPPPRRGTRGRADAGGAGDSRIPDGIASRP